MIQSKRIISIQGELNASFPGLESEKALNKSASQSYHSSALGLLTSAPQTHNSLLNSNEQIASAWLNVSKMKFPLECEMVLNNGQFGSLIKPYSFWEKITDQILFPLFVQYICVCSLTQNKLGLVVVDN